MLTGRTTVSPSVEPMGTFLGGGGVTGPHMQEADSPLLELTWTFLAGGCLFTPDLSKLYGTKEELEQTATFILQTGLAV